MTRLFYVGRDKREIAHGGQLAVEDPAAFVESRYKRGWSFLVVTDNDDRSLRLGSISTDLTTGKRTWWAESRAEASA